MLGISGWVVSILQEISSLYNCGVGAEKFRGVFDNTEIYHKLAELTGVQ